MTILRSGWNFEREGYVLPEEARFMGRDVGFAMNLIAFTPLPIEQVRQQYGCKPQLKKKEAAFEEEWVCRLVILTFHQCKASLGIKA